ncbi:Acetyl-coenzyme A synthetase [Bienertia sinuspersici]
MSKKGSHECCLAVALECDCRVEQFGLLMEGLEGEKMDIVESMGFGHLKHLSGQAMNKELGYWLMTRVQCVLGIPKGERLVPLQMDDTNRAEIDVAKDYVMGEEVDVEKYRVAFLVVLLGMFLCPTTNFSILASDLTPALCAAEEAKQYDWCSFVLDFLLRRARAFSHSFDKDGYAVGCGGCTYFLVVFYPDRLRWPPVRWGEYPRVKVFDKDLLKNVAEADRRNSGDFGKTKVANHIGEVIRTEVRVVVDVVSRLLGERIINRPGM